MSETPPTSDPIRLFLEQRSCLQDIKRLSASGGTQHGEYSCPRILGLVPAHNIPAKNSHVGAVLIRKVDKVCACSPGSLFRNRIRAYLLSGYRVS